jgi:hypothetical protein
MNTTAIPQRCLRNNCVIITVRTPDPTKDGATKRTTISMHQEHFKRLAEYLGGSDWVIRISKFVASNTKRGPGDNLSQLVWSQIEASKTTWRQAIEKGALK